MGSGSSRKGSLGEHPDFLVCFAPHELGPRHGKGRLTSDPSDGIRSLLEPVSISTYAKSRLIAEYLSLFQKVTGGGLYIDGFAAPQSRLHEDAWTARQVLEIKPPRLRTLWLCDIEPKGIRQLQRLRDQHHRKPRSRRVIVRQGDFNALVGDILKSGYLTPSASIFALLDQRNTECHWATARTLAAATAKPIPGSAVTRYKIELLYFVGSSWIHRALKVARKEETLLKIERWWGGPDWQHLKDLSQEDVVKELADRFVTELGYKFVTRYPVYKTGKGVQAAYHLIHASDHPEAPKLMKRAFRKIIGDAAGSPVDSQRSMFADLTD